MINVHFVAIDHGFAPLIRSAALKFKECTYLIKTDLYRYYREICISKFIRCYFLIPGFRYSFWLRICNWLSKKYNFKPIYFFVYFFILRRLGYRFGYEIPPSTQIGPGFYIGHYGGLVISGNAVIGRNCNVSHGVTLGVVNKRGKVGAPVIGDFAYIGPGAKIFGNLSIGDHVAIGANAVVLIDCPDESAVAGIPAKIISQKGSHGYVNNTDYDEILKVALGQ